MIFLFIRCTDLDGTEDNQQIQRTDIIAAEIVILCMLIYVPTANLNGVRQRISITVVYF